MNINYWVVGATWGSKKIEQDFFKRGYWEMGYADEEKPLYANKRDSVKAGDRIAVKRLKGQGATTVSILAIGIVKDVADKKVYIDWILTEMHREAPIRNYRGTIHGPIRNEEWLNQAFRI